MLNELIFYTLRSIPVAVHCMMQSAALLVQSSGSSWWRAVHGHGAGVHGAALHVLPLSKHMSCPRNAAAAQPLSIIGARSGLPAVYMIANFDGVSLQFMG